MKKSSKSAFTLTEVLITLGIIGTVAAMTMPNLMWEYKKTVAVSKLKKFYTIMQQAIQLSEIDYGDVEYWMPPQEAVRNSSEYEKWFNKYLAKSFKIISQKTLDSTYYEVGLADGSGFVTYALSPTTIHFFFCTELKYCGVERYDGQTSFLFTLGKVNNKFKFVTSNISHQNMAREELLEQCKYGNTDNADISKPNKRHACTRLIEVDGWTIKNDYPWQQTILEQKD